ncbi:MAG: hypothetical protein H0V44_14365, partial [Planctomycetes bacterium]|nr:hypothetical protein [Planctomycetota bacterium]
TRVDASPADDAAKAKAKADLDLAGQKVAAAASALDGVKTRMDQAAAGAAAASTAARSEADQAARNEQAAAERASASLASAEKHLATATQKSDAFGATVKAQVASTAGVLAKSATAETAQVTDAAKAGKAVETATQADEAAAAAKKLEASATKAKAAAAAAPYDGAALARAVIKDVEDKQLKGAMEESFKEGFSKEALPRLSQKLTETFKAELDTAGIKDDATVAAVGAKVSELLGTTVPGKVKAGDASTAALNNAEKIGDAKAEAKTDAGREKAVTDKLSALGDQAKQEMSALAKNDQGDGMFVDMAKAAGAGDGGRSASLLERVSTIAANANDGRMGMLDDSGSGSGGGVKRLRQAALERGVQLHKLLKTRGYFDKEQHEQLTAGIRERDQEAAKGQAWTRTGAEGAVSVAETSKDVVRPASMIIPPEPKAAATGDVAKTLPFTPQFKTINFAAIPFVRDAIVLDGDLGDWKNVPALQLKRCGVIEGVTAPDTQTAKIAWDNTGFYLSYDVTDVDGKLTKAHPDNFWEGDGVEVWFDALNSKDKRRGAAWIQQFWMWPFGSDGNDALVGGEAVNEDGKPRACKPFTVAEIQRAAKPTATGYSMEVHLPSQRLQQLEQQPGRIVGFNLSITTGTKVIYYWGGTYEVRTSERPDTWGDVLLAGSDSKVESPAKLASELPAGEVSKAARGVVIGEALKMRVTDPDMNLANDKRDKVSVTVRTQSGDSESAVLEETAAASGIFEGALPTALALGDQVPGTLSIYEGENSIVSYLDQARSDGSRKVEVKLTVASAAGMLDVAGR